MTRIRFDFKKSLPFLEDARNDDQIWSGDLIFWFPIGLP